MFKNRTRLWREAHLQVKMHKTPHCRSHFGSSDVQKWHAAVARSTFASQNAENTTLSEPFWKFRCSKMARGCGAKHICKSKCRKHHIVGAILEVPMFKNGQKWHAAVARSIFLSQNVEKLTGTDHFLEVSCQKNALRCGAKRICRSIWSKHLRFAAFCDVSKD